MTYPPREISSPAMARQIIDTQSSIALYQLARFMARIARDHVKRSDDRAARAFARRAATYATAAIRKERVIQQQRAESVWKA